MLLGHGGNIRYLIDKYKLPQNKILDFSSNLNPLGITSKIKRIITQNINLINQYPDPEYKSARKALADYWGIAKDNLLLGNGSNELIHLLPRALRCSYGLIYQPTFSEYALSLRLSGSKIKFLLSKEDDSFSVDINKIAKCIPKVGLIILCNPNNPTGYLLKKDKLLYLTDVCRRNKTYLLIDEVFMEFVDDEEKSSLLKEATRNKYLLVLRSLTKFFSVAGLRAGYLIADKELIRKISLFQPTWSVNFFAQQIISSKILHKGFLKKTKDYVKKEREFLFNGLKAIRQIRPYLPTANFIFSKILAQKFNAQSLFLHLANYGIIIRDCSNFTGVNGNFFRVAVRRRKDNLYFLQCLKTIFK